MENLKNISAVNEPLWNIDNQRFIFQKLDRDVSTEVIIIGGGIAGITTAYNLLKAGKEVVLIDESHIGSGGTGHTTAHLTACLDIRYYKLEREIGKENAYRVANSHMAAIEWIERTILNEKIKCNFKRVNGYLFSENHKTINAEFKAVHDLGINSELMSTPPGLTLTDPLCIKFPEQAQLHALNYMKGLTDAVIQMGGKIYCQTKAEHINSNEVTANGFSIKADHIVITTNLGLNQTNLELKQIAYRSYAIAARIPKSTIPYALWWELGQGTIENDKHQSYYYARLEKYDDLNDTLIVGGEDQELNENGQDATPETKYEKLLDWAKKRFNTIGKVEYKWSGIIRYSLDGLAYIGKTGRHNTYIITGDSGNGITYATIGSLIITDSICGRKNSWEDLYNPKRKADPVHLK